MVRARSTEEYKVSVLKRLLESSLSFRQFAIEEGIGISTLHKWKPDEMYDDASEGVRAGYCESVPLSV